MLNSFHLMFMGKNDMNIEWYMESYMKNTGEMPWN